MPLGVLVAAICQFPFSRPIAAFTHRALQLKSFFSLSAKNCRCHHYAILATMRRMRNMPVIVIFVGNM